jgi:uncharacterized protein (TIGR03067 family)
MKFHGADANDWINGTFTLREDADPKQCVIVITECPGSEFLGKKAYAIYKLDGATLTISGNGPGDPNIPSTLNDPDSRQFVFKRN